MKKKIIFIALCCFGCVKKDVSGLPYFEANSSIEEMWDPVKAIVNDKDFSVAYAVSSGGIDIPVNSIRVFSLKDSIWQKIEQRRGLTEIDTVFEDAVINMPTDRPGIDTTYKGKEADFIQKEVTLKKECRKNEAHDFLDKLIKYNLFDLPEEKELLKKCREARKDHQVPKYSDVGATIFYITEGRKVRRLIYQEHNREQDCPTLEWASIRKVRELFEKEWYSKKHY